MFQTFDSPTSPDQGPKRLAALRKEMAKQNLDGFLIPRADAHQGEYVAPRDERLAWLTGFTGSAGFAAVLIDAAGIFIDGRYRLQVKAQVADCFTPVHWPETQLADWLAGAAKPGDRIAYDPWLHTSAEISRAERVLSSHEISLVPSANLIDRIWLDQPPAPAEKIFKFPIEIAGVKSSEKRQAIAQLLKDAGHNSAVLTLPDSIAWMLNIRGADIARIPVPLCFAIIYYTGLVDLFIEPGQSSDLGPDPSITEHPRSALADVLPTLSGIVRVDPKTAPFAVTQILEAAGIATAAADDPCILPKARKSEAELKGSAEAHLRDGAAMVEFLAWLDQEAPKGQLTEIDVVRKLEGFRSATNALREISFDTICGSGPNGAIVHYRVTEDTNRAITPGELLLVDSGGQYIDGTTDITRTVAIGTPTDEHRDCFTRVLQGMIAVSRLRWPRGLAGRDLDSIARFPLWMAGKDYDHGTGHGVGVYMNVHEGPQRLSKVSDVPFEPGMILSNEPGYYRAGSFGIRIENLIAVQAAPPLTGADDREMLSFDTLTFCPIDLRLIDRDIMSDDEVAWLNSYHAETYAKLSKRVSDAAKSWLAVATRPL